ncbi:MAG: type II toxin-antitoxin system HicB family antitoxin [Hymenobacter sp.]|nr:MAG: type II toxin-antitoxin system HicB family antitoxin [Hymenobacter sp.]
MFPVVITWSITHVAFQAEVPDLTGCTATGATKAEALTASDRAISDWLQDARRMNRAVPTPRQRLRFT